MVNVSSELGKGVGSDPSGRAYSFLLTMFDWTEVTEK